MSGGLNQSPCHASDQGDDLEIDQPCSTCDGEGFTLERTGIDTEREVVCAECGDTDRDDYDDGDAQFDQMRDDRLTPTRH